MTVSEFTQNSAYDSWFTPGYDAYPPAEDTAGFRAGVNRINAVINGTESNYSIVMVLKPNCGCQHTQTEFPRLVKTLDAAGFPRENMQVYVTDSRIAGIDEIKAKYNLTSTDQLPAFIVLRNDTEIGRIEQEPSSNSTVESDLAAIFES